MKNFGGKIKALRLKKAVTQEQLAEHLGLSPQAVSKWENGVTFPDIQLLPEISVYFGVTIDELFDITDQKHFERIETMLETKKDLEQSDFDYAQNFLLDKISRKENLEEGLTLLSSLYNHRADEYRALAEYYALEALKISPEKKANHINLLEAQQGTVPDWEFSEHSKRIAYYKNFTAEHPDYIIGYMWLLDELLADNRCEEAEKVLEVLAAKDTSCRVPLYRGKLVWALGRQKEAMDIWYKMTQDFSDDWLAQCCMADCFAQTGHYREAIPYYEKALELQTAPRYTDFWMSIARIYEIIGEYDKAIKSWEQLVTVLKKEWKVLEGEAIDGPQREIERLTKLALALDKC